MSELPATQRNAGVGPLQATLRATYGEEVFRTMIPIATDYKEAVSLRRPVAFHKPRGAASKAIKAFSDECQFGSPGKEAKFFAKGLYAWPLGFILTKAGYEK